jgi:tRNA-specific 2-thiouridylase
VPRADPGARRSRARIREWSDAGLTVTPETPFDGVAPGQTAVLYDGTRVIGQFTIDRTVSAAPVLA